jgi:Zn-dependent protease with chaperone function
VDHVAKWFGTDIKGATLRVRVLGAEGVAAYGWRCGDLFVTRGLVDLLDDQELAAVLAHEMGHLIGDGGVRPVAGLSGGGDADANLAVEAEADRVGADLLRRHHLPSQAMPRMLAKVEQGTGLDSSCRDALRRRIELLRSVP